MGYSNRTSCRNLFLEQRNYGAITSQHIAESYSNEFCRGFLIKILDNHLTYSLGGSHNISRINCFVCAYHYKSLNMVLISSICYIPCTNYIILDCLIRAVLHKGNMLMGCCMIHNIRLEILEYPFQSAYISY